MRVKNDNDIPIRDTGGAMLSRSVLFTSTSEIEFKSEELEVKQLEPNQILIATEYSVVSAGTELSIWRGTENWAPLPAVPGYGAVGIVQKTGSAVTRCAPGDRIFCYGGHRNFSIVSADSMVVRVPEGLDPKLAVVARMGQVSFSAVRLGKAELGDTVAVQGLGLVGNLAAQLLTLAGCNVIGLDISEKRLAIAKTCGIEHTINTRSGDIGAAIKKMTGGKLCSTIVEATGIPGMVGAAAQIAERGGEVILLGTPRGEFSGDATELLRSVHIANRQVTLKGAHEWILPLYPTPYVKHSLERNVQQLFDFIKRGRLHIPEVITHCVPPTACREVYTKLKERSEDYFGVVFDWKAIA
jgi:2-desacetyl-2-hydroxyethyl bacteriochlorophyllide A dehydrogenase